MRVDLCCADVQHRSAIPKSLMGPRLFSAVERGRGASSGGMRMQGYDVEGMALSWFGADEVICALSKGGNGCVLVEAKYVARKETCGAWPYDV